MYELQQAKGNSFYIQSPAKIGLVKLSDTDVCLIDSGSDKDAGRKVRQILDQNGWHLTAIYNTHAHADHIGGNKYLQGQTGCRVFAPGVECAFANWPVLEPAFLYGGFPAKDLRHKFLMAQESRAEVLTPEALPEGMSILPLPGHFFDMTGFRTADDVVYLADCLSSRETLEKYGVVFLYDVGAQMRTLRMVREMQAALFVSAHAETTEDVTALAQLNLDKLMEVAERIINICMAKPSSFEDILQNLFLHYDLTMNFEQYVLVGSTVRSYLAWLKDGDILEANFEHGRLLWAVSD